VYESGRSRSAKLAACGPTRVGPQGPASPVSFVTNRISSSATCGVVFPFLRRAPGTTPQGSRSLSRVQRSGGRGGTDFRCTTSRGDNKKNLAHRQPWPGGVHSHTRSTGGWSRLRRFGAWPDRTGALVAAGQAVPAGGMAARTVTDHHPGSTPAPTAARRNPRPRYLVQIFARGLSTRRPPRSVQPGAMKLCTPIFTSPQVRRGRWWVCDPATTPITAT